MTSLQPRLEIDLRRIQDNYTDLVSMAGKTEVSAVLKANAYGRGMKKIAPALSEVGCHTFWVARTEEGIKLRSYLPHADIYVLSGPEIDQLSAYQITKLRPVLSSQTQLRHWQKFAEMHHVEPAALHVETGLNRLALDATGIAEAALAVRNQSLNVGLIISHLAAADDPAHPMNLQQLTRFEEIKKLFPSIPTSLSASFGFALANPAFKQDMVRIGRGLYGIHSPETGQPITRSCISLSAPVISLHPVSRGETVGYNATWIAEDHRLLATLSIGYADGIPRSFQDKGKVFFSDGNKWYAAPVTGRISMDLMTCDVTNIPPACVHEGTLAHFITKDHDISSFGELAGTIDYEILTHLGSRFDRHYLI